MIQAAMQADLHATCNADRHAVPIAAGEAALLKQVFVNLIDNACKYTRKRQDAAVEIGSCGSVGEPVIFVDTPPGL